MQNVLFESFAVTGGIVRSRPTPVRPITLVDIFCGVGGISLGFHDQGYKTLMAVDIDLPTVEIYRLNHPWMEDERILCNDVSTLTKRVLKKTIDWTACRCACRGRAMPGVLACWLSNKA